MHEKNRSKSQTRTLCTWVKRIPMRAIAGYTRKSMMGMVIRIDRAWLISRFVGKKEKEKEKERRGASFVSDANHFIDRSHLPRTRTYIHILHHVAVHPTTNLRGDERERVSNKKIAMGKRGGLHVRMTHL